MPCMCGDTYCPRCGPCFGNNRCRICGVWSADGGCVNPDACAKAQAEADDAEARDYEESKEYARQYRELRDAELAESPPEES